eukprot:scaffold61213_cov79-Phaeocystis_antarctica.AAC.4
MHDRVYLLPVSVSPATAREVTGGVISAPQLAGSTVGSDAAQQQLLLTGGRFQRTTHAYAREGGESQERPLHMTHLPVCTHLPVSTQTDSTHTQLAPSSAPRSVSPCAGARARTSCIPLSPLVILRTSTVQRMCSQVAENIATRRTAATL